ncbi:unnamed protein product [Withania somnifera]
MVETELEEGEAYNDDDSTIDPDVSLSYLDEKLHNVLGHFQRDFEGGVSAENLGSRFGGYGSFLPTYQRSPSWSHPRTPPEANNNNNRKISPNNLLPEKPRNADYLKTLKVRIKVGTKNLSTRKNAEIYSGLGLDVSPSPSLDGSPIGSEGVSSAVQLSPDESPTSILQLISLTENEKLSGKCGYEGKKKARLETLALVNGIGTHYANGEASEARKLKPCGKDSSAKGTGCDNQSGNALLSKKEIDIDSLACEELVSKALQFPLISNPFVGPPKDAEKVDSSKTATKGKTKEASSERASKKSLLPVIAIDTNSIDGSGRKGSSSRRTMEIKGTDCNDHSSGYLKKEVHCEEEKADDSSNNGQTKDGNAPNLIVVSPLRQSSRHKSSSNNGDGMKLAPEKELFASRDTRKPKGNQCHDTQSTEVIKEGSVADLFIASKGKKTSSSKILVSKSNSEDMKRNLAVDKFKEFFDDVELELEDAETGLEQIHSKEMLKVSDAINKKRLERNSSMKEKVNGRKIEKPFTSAEYPRLASNDTPHTVCESNPAVPPGAGAPLVKEDWVCCDKCQTWRILPLGTDPDSLPKKWVCRLQTWLPGMNRCGISEEETTKALRALYQVPMSGATAPASEKLYSQHEYPGGAFSGVTSIDTSHAFQDHQKAGIQAVDAGGKKIYGSKGVLSATKQEGSLSSNCFERNRQGIPNSRSSDGTAYSPTNENGHQLEVLPSSSTIENQRYKQKENRKSLENHSDAGIKNLKMRNTSETDLDGSAAKELRRDDVHYDDDPVGAKQGQSSNTGLSNSGSEKVRDKYKKSKADSSKSLALAKNPESHSLDGSVHKCDSKDSLKKRKRSECQNPETHPPRDIVEETCDNGGRKEKKARVSKASGGTDGKGRGKKEERVGQNLDSTLSQRSADVEDSSKRELSALQPSVAATSSSSQVSGSHKNRTSLQELKGSPVESVSSSPLRISKKDICSSAKRNPKRKEDHKNANFISNSKPRSSYGENDRCSNRSGMTKKEEGSNDEHHGLESSGIDYQEKDVHDVSGATIKAKITSSDFATHQDTDVATDPLGQANQYAYMTENSDQGPNNERSNSDQVHNNGSISKDEKVLLLQHKEKNRTVRSDSGKCKTKDPDISNESSDRRTYEGKLTSGSNKFEDKSGASSDRSQQGSKKDSFGKLLNENVTGDIRSKFGHHESAEVKLDAMSSMDRRQAALTDRDDGRPFSKLASDKTQQIEVPEKGMSHLTSPSIRGQSEAVQSSRPVPAFKKEGVTNLSALDAFEGEKLNASKQGKNLKATLETHLIVCDTLLRLHIRSGMLAALLGRIPLVKLLQMLLKKPQALNIWQIASRFVAHEYERLKDMAAVSLAYKCMEVAYMRVIYSSHFNANRYTNELQTALQIFPPGESPSSSASDVDNLNNPTMVDKGALAKGVASPQVAGTHVISARNRASFTRLFNFAQEVNLAMDASRKSRSAFAVAYPGQSDTKCKEPALSVKKALDFNFQDVDCLLRLVRIAMEAISR